MTRFAGQIIDSHTHLMDCNSADRHLEVCRSCGHAKSGIVCTISEERINTNPPALFAKSRYNSEIFAFCALDHSSAVAPSVTTPSLAEQVDLLLDMGVDGIKMLEGKATTRQWLNISVDSDYFADYFVKAQDTRIPILWHVNDPEEFWDPDRIPVWAAERNWGYDETDVQKEEQYTEIDNVLQRYPELNIIFAHFYFLSADLPRAAAFLDKHPNVNFDLALGIEYLYNMSDTRDAARDFFIKYADRIVFGTDIISELADTPEKAQARAGLITRWLETAEEYHVPDEADFLLGDPEDGLIRGLNLPDEVLQKIYKTNYERITGLSEPKKLDTDLAREECKRLAAIAEDKAEAERAAELI